MKGEIQRKKNDGDESCGFWVLSFSCSVKKRKEKKKKEKMELNKTRIRT